MPCAVEFTAHPSNATNYDGTTIDNRMVRMEVIKLIMQTMKREKNHFTKEGEFYKLLVAYKQLLEWDNADETTRLGSGYPQDDSINGNFNYVNIQRKIGKIIFINSLMINKLE